MNQKELEIAVTGKLAAEGLSINSDWGKIEKCLSKVIARTKCIKIAYYLKYGIEKE